MILLIIIGIFIYSIIGNIIIRYLDSNYYIQLSQQDKILPNELTIFLLGLFLPLVLSYILVREISIYIYNRIFNT